MNNYDWEKGMILLDQCLKHIEVARAHHLDCLNHDKSDIVELQTLESQVKADKCLIRAKAHIDTMPRKVFKNNLIFLLISFLIFLQKKRNLFFLLVL